MKKYLWILMLVLAGISFSKQGLAQFDLSCDLMSRYVWRGTDFGKSPSIQPGMEYSYKGFTIGTWGAYAINGWDDMQEVDIFVSYSYKEMITLCVTDYFFPIDGAMNKYGNYKANSTSHVFEATLSFDGTENFPLTILAGTIFFGDDLDVNSDNRYSTYAELGYSFSCKNDVSIDPFIGFNLNKQSNADKLAGIGGFYGNTFGVVNLGLTAEKEIKITDEFNLPLSVSLITNPQAENIYLVAGFTF